MTLSSSKRNYSLATVAFLFVASLVELVQGAGILSNYQRACDLFYTCLDKVAHDRVVPHWTSDGNAFWYRSYESNMDCQFYWVDAMTGVRELAFDHEKVALALGKVFGGRIDPAPVAYYRHRIERYERHNHRYRGSAMVRRISRLFDKVVAGASDSTQCAGSPERVAGHSLHGNGSPYHVHQSYTRQNTHRVGGRRSPYPEPRWTRLAMVLRGANLFSHDTAGGVARHLSGNARCGMCDS